jgi:hypothetical protein
MAAVGHTVEWLLCQPMLESRYQSTTKHQPHQNLPHNTHTPTLSLSLFVAYHVPLVDADATSNH